MGVHTEKHTTGAWLTLLPVDGYLKKMDVFYGGIEIILFF